ncbi:MAG: hypothetical protein ACR2MX_16085, partial [Cyclobacteriaceae bacterium]
MKPGFSLILYVLIVNMVFTGCTKHWQIFGVTKEFCIQGVVWDYHTDKPIRDVKVQYLNEVVKTDPIGYFKFDLSKNENQLEQPDTLVILPMTGPYSSKRIPVSRYLQFYTIQLKDSTKNPVKSQASKRPKSADMHYHLGLKGYNEYGNYLFFKQIKKNRRDALRDGIELTKLTANNHLAWERRFKHLRVLDPQTGKWHKARKLDSIEANEEGSKKARILYQQYLGLHLKPKPKRANNTLYDFSQASFPLAKQGNVRLIFNSVTPLEKDLSRTPGLRFVNILGKTNAKAAWLKKVGTRKDFSHWLMFNQSYELLKKQEGSGTYFGQNWKFLRQGSDLEEDTASTFVVNVVEGAHALQNEDFNNSEILFKQKYDSSFKEAVRKDLADRSEVKELVDPKKTIAEIRGDISQQFGAQSLRRIEQSSDSVFYSPQEQALGEQINNLKKLDPPIYMVTIGHLSNNLMLDHAPALDANGVFSGIVR